MQFCVLVCMKHWLAVCTWCGLRSENYCMLRPGLDIIVLFTHRAEQCNNKTQVYKQKRASWRTESSDSLPLPWSISRWLRLTVRSRGPSSSGRSERLQFAETTESTEKPFLPSGWLLDAYSMANWWIIFLISSRATLGMFESQLWGKSIANTHTEVHTEKPGYYFFFLNVYFFVYQKGQRSSNLNISTHNLTNVMSTFLAKDWVEESVCLALDFLSVGLALRWRCVWTGGGLRRGNCGIMVLFKREGKESTIIYTIIYYYIYGRLTSNNLWYFLQRYP